MTETAKCLKNSGTVDHCLL